ncbi:hypothetical protein CDL15_Pgr018613 [Punica granatum]|uniref:Uncharacterized protein n=1 Tax=Punica granatum TaxID=22663 RepID=A0A218WZA9_PUNGR|nr:hypothetical protein CDL15_Pgr018613 [Punica granatum]
MEGKHHQEGLDLFPFFMLEESGDSGADSSNDPNTGSGYCHYRCYYDCYNMSTSGDVEEDAESCVFDSCHASSSRNLHDLDDDPDGEAEVEESRAGNDGSGARDLRALISTAVMDHHHHDDRESSFVFDDDDSANEDHYRDHHDQGKSVSDDSISKGHILYPYHKVNMSEKEKDKLFWEACLAS